jgi:hypothetical protein
MGEFYNILLFGQRKSTTGNPPREIHHGKSTSGNPPREIYFAREIKLRLGASSVGLPDGSGLFPSEIDGGVEA